MAKFLIGSYICQELASDELSAYACVEVTYGLLKGVALKAGWLKPGKVVH